MTCCSFSLILPVEGHTKLAVDEAGLAVLRKLKPPIVPIVVIGPYRSGKSFLLNQLLGVGCGEPAQSKPASSSCMQSPSVHAQPVQVSILLPILTSCMHTLLTLVVALEGHRLAVTPRPALQPSPDPCQWQLL